MDNIKNNKNTQNNNKTIFKQILSFLFVSGIGWLIDFSIFTLLTSMFDLPILLANCISSAPAVLWVFVFSSKKIFSAGNSNLKLWHKYLIYFAYQIILIFIISSIGQFIFDQVSMTSLMDYEIIKNYCKIIIKIIITPVTMTINFIVMKLLIEKL